MTEELKEILQDFTESLKQSIAELKEINTQEVCLLKDEGSGLWCEMHSRKLSGEELLNITASGFNFLKANRENKSCGMVG